MVNGDLFQDQYTGQLLGAINANGATVSSGNGNPLTMQPTQSAYNARTFTIQN